MSILSLFTNPHLKTVIEDARGALDAIEKVADSCSLLFGHGQSVPGLKLAQAELQAADSSAPHHPNMPTTEPNC
jgi:hypothetical protein